MSVKFGTILADPPWKNRSSAVKQEAFSAEHYDGLTVEQLCDLPVASVAANDAYLFLWADSQHQYVAPQVAAAWGFREYATTLTWLKTNPGTGNPCAGIGRYSMVWSETLWLFKRGKPKLVETSWKNPFSAPRREHSRKPDEIYDYIEAVHRKKNADWQFPVPRLELFARTHSAGVKLWDLRPGWTQLGDECEGTLGYSIQDSLGDLLARE
jgi:N6-adenosine-specific RNA methylase IME4